MKIEYPVIRGAMAWVSDAKLASVVSEAGGQEMTATAGRTASWTREEIKKGFKSPSVSDIVLQDQEWREKLRTVLQEKPARVLTEAGNPVPLIAPLHEAGIKIFPLVLNIRLAKRVESAGADALIMEGGGVSEVLLRWLS